jgi:RND superfamily putative drug exporter
MNYPYNSTRSAIVTIFVWIGVIVTLALVAPPISEVTTNEQEEFLPVGVESVQALEILRNKYPMDDGMPAIAVFHSDDGFDEFELDGIHDYIRFLGSDDLPGVIFDQIPTLDGYRLINAFKSSDGSTFAIPFKVTGSPSDPSFSNSIDAAVAQAQLIGGRVQVDANLTGPATILRDAVKIFQSIDLRITLVTILVVIVIMFFIYRAPGLVFIPLLILVSALMVARFVAALVVDLTGLPLNDQVTSIMSVLLFGVGTNYVLFIVSRYREEITNSSDRFRAMESAMRKVGPSIIGSSMTTVVAMFLLIFSTLGSFKTMGPMLAITVSIMLIVALTVLPAAIVLMSRLAFWPSRTIASQQNLVTKPIWEKIGRFVVNRPKTVFLVTTAILLIAITPSFRMVPSFNFIDGFPDDVESKSGYALLKKGFAPGDLSPTSVFIHTPDHDVIDHSAFIEGLANAIEDNPGVNHVKGMTRPYGSYIGQQVDEASLKMFNSTDGTTSRLDVSLMGDPYSEKALTVIEDIRSIIQSTINSQSITGVEVLVGGDTAVQLDTKTVIDEDTRLLAPLILFAILCVLILIQRSFVAPLYLLFSVIISYAATFGISIFIFQDILNHTGVAYSNGIWIFVFLVALGADYNIFVIARIKEETERLGFNEGIAVAVGKTGGVVTSAGIILASTFAVLTTLPLRDVFQLGMAVMLGVLIDTFVVRTLLVPSMAAILKNYSWWPSLGSRKSETTQH